jgi:TorA maturation chaperone TorD
VSTGVAAPASETAAVALWRLLSLGLAQPSVDVLEMVDGLAEGVAELPSAPHGLAALREALPQSSPESIAISQARLFGRNVRVAPYEGSYEDDPFRQARQMSDVAGFYRAFGAEAHGPAFERPDHAGCELEFLAFLGARRLAAAEIGRSDEAELCLEIEEAFLREHAGRWLPGFFRALEQAASDAGPGAAFHAALGRLGAEVVEAELARRQIEPEPLGPRARRLAVEADELECGSGPDPITPLLPPARRRP